MALSALASAASAQVPDAIAAPGETVVATLHAEGAQVYECKADAGGKLAWQFREPIATLLLDGKTVGRHYAGPTLGARRRQRGDGQGGRPRARRQPEGHPVAQARRDGAPRHRGCYRA